MKNSFTKAERLCSKKTINGLFTAGKSFVIEPFRVVWMQTHADQEVPAQVLISVSSHKFKNSVDRNRIKRLVREVYRKNKHSFYENLITREKHCAFGIFYISKELPVYSLIEPKIILILQRLMVNIK